MTSLTGSIQHCTGSAQARVQVSFRPIGSTRVRVAALIPPFEATAQSDDDGAFLIDLLDGEYEVRFDGRGAITITVPDDPDNTYNVAGLIADAPGIIEVTARTMPTRGINYLFGPDYHYFRNLTTGLWHTYTFEGDPATPLIGPGVNVTPATTIALSGLNYAFQSDISWRLKNATNSLFYTLTTEGAYGFESGVVGATGAALAPAAAVFARGSNMRVVGRLQQFFNITQGKWTTPYITGPEMAESMTWYPSVV